MHLKESAATFSPPPVAPRKAPPKSLDQVKPNSIPAHDGPVSSSSSFDHDLNQEGECMSLSVFLASMVKSSFCSACKVTCLSNFFS